MRVFGLALVLVASLAGTPALAVKTPPPKASSKTTIKAKPTDPKKKPAASTAPVKSAKPTAPVKAAAPAKGKTPEPPPPPEDPLLLGQEAFAAREFEKAERLFREAIEQEPERALAHYHLGRALKRRGDCAGALSSFAEARERGAALLPLAELESSELECRVMLAEIFVPPQVSASAEARVAREEGAAAYARRDFSSAEKALVRSLAARPEDAEAHYLLGLTYNALGRGEEAGRALSLARRVDPGLSFTTPEQFRAALAKAQAHTGASPGGPPAILRAPALDAALADLRRGLESHRVALVALPGAPFSSRESATLAQAAARFSQEHRAALAVVRVSETQDPEAVADALWSLELRPRGRALLLVEGAGRVRLRSSLLPPASLLATETSSLSALSSLDGALRAHILGRFLVLLGESVGGALLLGIALVALRRRVAARSLAYRRVLDRIDAMLPAVADELAAARLALRIVPADEIEDLLEAGERLFFSGRDLRAGLSPRGDPEKVRRAEESLFVLEEAERKARRAHRYAGSPPVESLALGCFFCACPIGAESGGYHATIAARGVAESLLVCRICAASLRRGEAPRVLMVLRKGRRRHWSQTRAFSPRYDFYRPRLPVERLAAVDAWSEIFGDEDSLPAFPEARPATLSSPPKHGELAFSLPSEARG